MREGEEKAARVTGPVRGRNVLLYTVRLELSSHLTSQPEAATQQQRMGYRGGDGSGQALREHDQI